MALAGEEIKEMRMSGSMGYDHIETLEHDHHLQQQRSRGSDPDRYSGAGTIAGATTVLNSGGSKSKTASARYRECLKNHAASLGGSVTDGCGEFMPSGEEGTLEALKCAACNCHRNFHRKEADADSNAIILHPLQLPPPLPSPSVNQPRAIPMGMHTNHWTMARPVKMAFGGGSAATDSSSEELNFNAVQPPLGPPFGLTKKRFRTKFTQEQREKMMEFAEKVGWRIPKEDDAEAQRFCAEVGVKRQVLKVWMHNNKNSVKKSPQESIIET